MRRARHAAGRQHRDDLPVTAGCADAWRLTPSFLLRIDPGVLDALQRWANDDLRSLNGQIEFLLRRALAQAGRTPSRLLLLPWLTDPQADVATDDSPLDEKA